MKHRNIPDWRRFHDLAVCIRSLSHRNSWIDRLTDRHLDQQTKGDGQCEVTNREIERQCVCMCGKIDIWCKQTDRQTSRKTNGTNRRTYRYTGRHTDEYTKRKTDGFTRTQTGRQTDERETEQEERYKHAENRQVIDEGK